MNANDNAVERRAAPRAPVRTNIRILYPDLRRLVDEICRDISIGGMFVESPTPPAVGTEIAFELFLPTRKPTVVKGEGEVVWCRSDTEDGRQAGFGVRFVRVDPRFRTVIFRVVDRLIQGGGAPFDLEPES